MGKLPAFQFYPGDWMKDPNVRRCSPAARGVWMDMLCLAFECEDRGVLASGDQPWTDAEISAAVTGPTDVVLSCISELLSKGVCARNKSGAIFSKRMVRDEHERKEWRQRQKKHRISKEGCHEDVTHSSQPSSSSSSSSNTTTNPPTPLERGIVNLRFWGGTLKIHLGRKKRLPQSVSLQGARVQEAAEFYKGKGFEVEILDETKAMA